MSNNAKFFIDGEWTDPAEPRAHDVVNPATEQVVATISLGNAADVDKAVAAAKKAFASYSTTPVAQRQDLLKSIIEVYKKRSNDIAAAVTSEMGAPVTLARKAHAPMGLGHFQMASKALDEFVAEEKRGNSVILREPIGVCGFITPWNWPLNQMACKVAPALAAGCTSVLKPSEMSPLNAIILAEVLAEAGVPDGVFNLVNGDGPTVGEALARHPDIDLISFTGSTRAGVQVAKLAADTVKRVAQELGGKSPNIILEDADLEASVKGGIQAMMGNTGQSCNAPSRMLVPEAHYEQALEVAAKTADAVRVGDPNDPGTQMGPLASKVQYERVRGHIQKGIDEGARLVTGGLEKPEGIDKGYFVRPTVFADAKADMQIVREEIFGPVQVVQAYRDEEQAIEMANDTPYGLSAYVSSGDKDHARRVAGRLRAGMVHINGAGIDPAAPFGGYKQSGNGREWGMYGLEEFFEVKSLMSYEAA